MRAGSRLRQHLGGGRFSERLPQMENHFLPHRLVEVKDQVISIVWSYFLPRLVPSSNIPRHCPTLLSTVQTSEWIQAWARRRRSSSPSKLRNKSFPPMPRKNRRENPEAKDFDARLVASRAAKDTRNATRSSLDVAAV